MTPGDSRGPILCFGEVLWDCLPTGRCLGGAPVNVAYHLSRLGCEAVPVTAVGEDDLGREILDRFDRWQLSRKGVTVAGGKPTGTVTVTLDDAGVPSYDIVQDVAWDWIELPDALTPVASAAAGVVFGTLAQRQPHNRDTLKRLLQSAPDAVTVFDVNLRPPFDSPELARSGCQRADLVKLNLDELRSLLDESGSVDPLDAAVRTFARRMGCERVCLTAGSGGAGLLWEGHWYYEPSRPIEVHDTVGAGDAFLAGLLQAWLDGKHPEDQLRSACRLAEFVAESEGATPEYSKENAQGKN